MLDLLDSLFCVCVCVYSNVCGVVRTNHHVELNLKAPKHQEALPL